MADAAVTFLLENVTLLLRSYVDLVSGAENELEQLKNELGLLKAFLQEAAKKPKKEEPLREWERQIREVVYDAEDAIDSCLTQALAEKGKRRSRLLGGTKRVNLAKQVKSVRVDKVEPMFNKARMDFANMGEGSTKRVQDSSTKDKKVQSFRRDKVVGFEDEEKTLTGYLKEQREELDVISIIGMPGLGKTTLAWKIYQNQDIQYAFPIRIWIYVSQDFKPRDVFLSILKGFTKQDMSSMTDDDLILTVRAFLEKENFLLVLDDLWSVDAWIQIKNVLPLSNRRGKVLITSRHLDVGKHANVTREPHGLRFLTEDESWELLQLEAFQKVDGCPGELIATGKYIAKQCDGLPLALVVIGGILVDKGQIKSEWEKVSENVNMHVRNDEKYRPSDVVALSYNELSGTLRDCLLYMGVFPEDYEIRAWTLTRLWIAEGFIQHKEGESLEETAEEILKELVNRNLVMVEKTSPNGKVKTCRVHDVIREFCKSRAAIGDQNLFKEIKKSEEEVFDPPAADVHKYRRLSIHSHLSEFLSDFLPGKLKGPRVRSFFCFNKDPFLLDAKYLSTIPDTFILLRVLDSKSFKFNQFPPRVIKLIHLRYLTLSCDSLSVLPEIISELWNLQTLVVGTKSRTLEIKASIWKMNQLRYLKTKAAIILAVQEEGEAGKNLQTLSRLSPEYCTAEVLKRVRNLKHLGIRGNLAILLDGKFLGPLGHLETLKMKNDLSSGSPSENPLPGLPPANCFPTSIKNLTLSATYLDWKHMSTLGMIGTLQVLKLKDNAFRGKSWKAVGDGFTCLQFLLIDETDLVFWEASNEHFPTLGCLVLRNCEKLSQIPLSLAKSLQTLDIDKCKSTVESAREIEKETKLIPGQKRRGGFKLKIGPGI